MVGHGLLRTRGIPLPPGRLLRVPSGQPAAPGGGTVRQRDLAAAVVPVGRRRPGLDHPDYVAFCQMLAGGGQLDGRRVLGRKTLELMTVNHLRGGATLQEMAVGGFGEANFDGVGFGLGFAVGLGTLRPPWPSSRAESSTGAGCAPAPPSGSTPAEDLFAVFHDPAAPHPPPTPSGPSCRRSSTRPSTTDGRSGRPGRPGPPDRTGGRQLRTPLRRLRHLRPAAPGDTGGALGRRYRGHPFDGGTSYRPGPLRSGRRAPGLPTTPGTPISASATHTAHPSDGPGRRAPLATTTACTWASAANPLYGRSDLIDDTDGLCGVSTDSVAEDGGRHRRADAGAQVGGAPLYVSVDIDVLDPAHRPEAPAPPRRAA